MKIKVLQAFDHHGLKKEGEVFEISEKFGTELISKGLAKLYDSDAEEKAKAEAEAKAAEEKSKAKPKGKE